MIRHDFTNQVVFITGATSGIGLAAARAFAAAGARVVLAARDAGFGSDAAARFGGEAFFVPCDVRDEGSVAAAVASTVQRFGRLDVAFNCAGVGGDFAPLERTNQDVWDDVMATNARGVWLSMRHEIPAMLAAGGGAIVNMSSVYGLAGKAAHHAYVASKHAVIGMTRSVALEFATRGIRVNALCAGVTRTASMRAAEEVMPDAVRGLVNEHPMKRMATETEIANAVLWLCSSAAGFATGTPLVIDGGFLS